MCHDALRRWYALWFRVILVNFSGVSRAFLSLGHASYLVELESVVCTQDMERIIGMFAEPLGPNFLTPGRYRTCHAMGLIEEHQANLPASTTETFWKACDDSCGSAWTAARTAENCCVYSRELLRWPKGHQMDMLIFSLALPSFQLMNLTALQL